ncbi:MAG: sigma-70 family RNA polymerase sigma factor [Planctomycetes bacterium]|nr:sigma-70 family RNA polymerase sigma factor [Planctomycetota bacterium]
MERIGRLFEANARRVWGLARSLTRTPEDADDLVQQTFTIAITKRAEVPDNAWPWLAKVVSFCARNHYRRNARRQGMEDVHETEISGREPDPADAAGKRELLQALHAALEELSHDEREAVALCHLGGLSQSEACQVVGVGLNTLKARVRRGLQHLQEKLGLSEAGATAFLSSFVFPPPRGGWDQAIARWESRAWEGADVARSPAPFSGIKLLAAAAIAVLAGMGAWLAASMQNAGLEPNRNPEIGSTASDMGSSTEPDVVLSNPAKSNSNGDQIGRDSARPENAMERAGEKPGTAPKEGAQPKEGSGDSRGGELVTRRTYYANGRIESEWTELVTPGKAVKHGTFTNFWPNGIVRESGEYRDDLREGSWTYQYEDGIRFTEGEYLHNKPHGSWKVYDKQGNPETTGRYENGEHVGEWITFHPNGQKALIQNFEREKLNGLETEFDDQGRKRRETTWVKNKKHGWEIIWDENCNEISRRQFNQGK